MLRMIVAAAMLASASAAAPSPPPREIAYGSAPLQRLDFHPAAASRGRAPVLVFIHGGGWSRGDKGNATGAAKITHFTQRGWAVASLNYRLVPAARVEDSAHDVAAAIARLRRDAAALGIDPERMVVMGHSAGAHLAALVATDPEYLQAQRLVPGQLAGIVLLDGAGYNVAGEGADGARAMSGVYLAAFGTDAARHRRLSPTLHAARPNAPRFLILHIDRAASRAQSLALAAALTANGAAAEVRAMPGRGMRGHMQINRSLGDPAYPATAIVDGWVDAAVRR